jgi:hypothetical protein
VKSPLRAITTFSELLQNGRGVSGYGRSESQWSSFLFGLPLSLNPRSSIQSLYYSTRTFLLHLNMPLPKKNDEYSTLTLNYTNLDEDSDTTLGSADLHEKRSKRRKRICQPSRSTLTWFRWGSLLVMQSTILVLLVLNTRTTSKEGWTKADTETGGDVNGLYVPSSCTF